MTFNVVNKEAVRDYLSSFATGEDDTVDGALLTHLMTALEKPLLRDGMSLSPIRKLPPDAPDWLVKKWNAGTSGALFYRFDPQSVFLKNRIHHISDWIRGAMINDADWTRKTDRQGRIKRLVHLGSKVDIDDLYQEADADIIREAARLKKTFMAAANDNDISDYFEFEETTGDIETVMTFEDGHRIIRLLTPDALKKETVFMGHCIGQGGYDEAVRGDTRRFHSLRDPQNKPHATFDVETQNNTLHQCKGKENTPPVEKYSPYVQGFVKRERFKLTEEPLHTGLIEQDDDYYDIFNLPPGFRVRGHLSYYTAEGIKRRFFLPEGLTVDGLLLLQGCTGLTALPKGLKVLKSLNLYGCTNLTVLPDGLEVGSNLNLACCRSLMTLPNDLKVEGDLDLSGCTNLTTLPDDLEVHGMIYTYFGTFANVAAAHHTFEEKFGTPTTQKPSKPAPSRHPE